MRKQLLLALALLVFSSVPFIAVQAENDKAFFWQVTSPKGVSGHDSATSATVYLLGSIHFADKSFYPLRKEIEDAFSRSDSLVVELDIGKTDSGAYNRLLSQRGIYKDGTTIKDVVSD